MQIEDVVYNVDSYKAGEHIHASHIPFDMSKEPDFKIDARACARGLFLIQKLKEKHLKKYKK